MNRSRFLLFAPETKSFSFEVEDLTAGAPPIIDARLQGVSTSENHVRVFVNGTAVTESTFSGKSPLKLLTEIPAGVLREGTNELSIENVGDTDFSYSMVMLDRFVIEHSHRVRAGLALDVTEPLRTRWIRDGSSFRAEADRSYLLVGDDLKNPEVERVVASTLKSAFPSGRLPGPRAAGASPFG